MLIFQVYEFLGHFFRPHQTYRAVVFDLCQRHEGLVNSIEQIASSNDSALGRMVQDYELGKISFEKLRNVVNTKVNGEPTNFKAAEVEEKDENLWRAFERLRFYGIKVAILTNVGFEDDRMDRTIGPNLSGQVDLIVESCRLRMRKPNPRIYEHTARELKLQTDECVYVDQLARNCRGAEIAGMKSIQVMNGDTKRAVDQLSKLLGLDLF
ncbi:Bifunctional epoxide hydrolase 2 [Aphelenchoides besseyi]|nr:Bifunctional epoxide hydrolase 2 [Aphelenchoides besseyi]KAI6192962.1 Bifunctional epoxide hydrolase 2 [Aphelenchoides besseyi]